MIFHFYHVTSNVGSFQLDITSDVGSFQLDIPVSFTIPDKFNAFVDLGIIKSYQKEVGDKLDSLGIKPSERFFKLSKDRVVVHIKYEHFDRIRKELLREQRLKELGI
jgi:hypothetical protein